MKYLLKYRQQRWSHCSVVLESNSETKSRWKRRETSFGARCCSASACCTSSQVRGCILGLHHWSWVTPSLSQPALKRLVSQVGLSLTQFGVSRDTGASRKSLGTWQSCSSYPGSDQPQRPNFLPFPPAFKPKESSEPSHELSTATGAPLLIPPLPSVPCCSLHHPSTAVCTAAQQKQTEELIWAKNRGNAL